MCSNKNELRLRLNLRVQVGVRNHKHLQIPSTALVLLNPDENRPVPRDVARVASSERSQVLVLPQIS
jgi:hypothetical protein